MTFQEIIESYGKQLSYSCTINSPLGNKYKDITEDDMYSVNPHYDGALYTSVMRCLDVILKGDHRTVEKGYIFCDNKFTVKKDGNTQTINYGSFIVAEAPEFDDRENTTKFICYDLMYKTMQPYELREQYPITLAEYLSNIAFKCKLKIANISELKNGDKVLTGDKYLNVAGDESSTYQYRDVLDDIARCAGCSFTFKSDANGEKVDELYIVYVTDGNGSMKTPVHTLDVSNFKTLTIGEKYGPANTVVFSRQPQEDNVYLMADGVTDSTAVEVKLRQPLIAEGTDEERQEWLQSILAAVKGTEYWCFYLESFGIGFLNFGDVFRIRTYKRDGLVLDENQTEEYTSVFMRTDMLINGDVKESAKLEMPVATSTDYKAAATEKEKRMLEAWMKVDKQLGEIVAVVKDPENGLETKLKQTAESVLAQAKSIETLTKKYDNLSKDFSNLDIAGTVTTEVQKETTLELIAGKVEAKVSANYASKSDLSDYVKNEALTTAITATENKITEEAKRITQIEKAGYITETEAQGLIDQSSESIALSVKKDIKIGTRNILLDSACFGSFSCAVHYAKVETEANYSDNSIPSGMYKQITFTPTRNGLCGICFDLADILGEEQSKITKLSNNKTYTLSFWCKSSINQTINAANLLRVGTDITTQHLNTPDLSVGTSWKKHTLIFTIAVHPTNFSLWFLFQSSKDAQHTIYFSSFKLEEGNIATDWTPNQTELANAVQAAEAKLELCVQTDENGNLKSAIHAKANQITIESDNFTLDGEGNMTCSNANITGGRIYIHNNDDFYPSYVLIEDGNLSICIEDMNLLDINSGLIIMKDTDGSEIYSYCAGFMVPGGLQIAKDAATTLVNIQSDGLVDIFGNLNVQGKVTGQMRFKTGVYFESLIGATPAGTVNVNGKSVQYTWLAVNVNTGELLWVTP